MADATAREDPGPRIVVGVDGSDGSHLALAWALDEARRRGASVLAVMAWHDPYTIIGRPLPAEAAGGELDQLRAVLARAVADAQAAAPGPAVSIRALIRTGQPADVLAGAAAGADLLVVGSRGRGGFRGLLLGSVSQRCAQVTPVPLVIVPASAGADADGAGQAGAGVEMPMPPRVVAP